MDISTFPRHELLVALYYLRHSKKIKNLRLLYVSPIGYGKWLSRGYKRFSMVPFFEGPSAFDKKIALLILGGFEKERALSLIDDLEPSAVFFAHSEPGTSEHFTDTGKNALDDLKSRSSVHTEILKIPGNDPIACKNALIELFRTRSNEYDFFVAPIGPKLAVVGLYLAYEENPIFRIVYPHNILYNVEHYSKGCRDLYEIILTQ